MSWVKLTSKALYLMDSGSNEYLEKVDLILTRAIPEQYKIDLPLEWLKSSDAPGQVIVALESKEEPKQKATPPLPTPTRHHIRVTKSGMRRSDGLEALSVDLMMGNKKIDSVAAVSGQPDAQAFRLPSESRSGSAEPLPEGVWDLGMPKPDPITKKRPSLDILVEFASGTSGDFSKDWPAPFDGLGPIYIEMTCRKKTSRSDIGFHLDNNSNTSPGTVGCIGIVYDSGLKSLKKFISWFDDSKIAPHYAIVDWGLGSV
jgi:lysozyme